MDDGRTGDRGHSVQVDLSHDAATQTSTLTVRDVPTNLAILIVATIEQLSDKAAAQQIETLAREKAAARKAVRLHATTPNNLRLTLVVSKATSGKPKLK